MCVLAVSVPSDGVLNFFVPISTYVEWFFKGFRKDGENGSDGFSLNSMSVTGKNFEFACRFVFSFN